MKSVKARERERDQISLKDCTYSNILDKRSEIKGVITETPSPSHVPYTDTSWQNSLNHNNAVTPQPLSRTHWYYLAGSDNSDIYTVVIKCTAGTLE